MKIIGTEMTFTGKRWCSKQCKLFKSGKLESWKIKLLNDLDFDFNRTRYFFKDEYKNVLPKSVKITTRQLFTAFIDNE